MRRALPLLTLLVGCSLDWDRYDPRGGEVAAASSSSSSSAASSSSSGASGGGMGGAGGSGGAAPVCGDASVDAGEQCDDGNVAAGDGCDDACQVECAGGVIRPQTFHCYVVVQTTVAWQPARDACTAMGAGFDLVALSSQAEWDWFIAEPSVTAALATAAIWTGGTDVATEGTFVWSNGEPWFDDVWGPTQPDDYNMNEDCVQIRVSDSLLNDINCPAAMYYACERPPAGR